MGGAYSNPDCRKCKYNQPFTSRTFTEDTVGSSMCKIESSSSSEQVIEFTLESDANTKYIHARARPKNGDISVKSPSDNWIDNVKLSPGEKRQREFDIKQSNGSTSQNEKLIMEIYYSNNKLSVSDPDREIPNKADSWGRLKPKLELS